LQFASLSFLFFALIRKLELKIPGVIGVSVLCSVAGMILNSRISEIDTPVIQAVTGLFWGTHEGSYFPFLSWIPYVSAGYVFATFLRQTDDKKKFYLRISSMSGAVYLALTFIAVQFYDWVTKLLPKIYKNL